VPKFNASEMTIIKDIVARLTIGRLPDSEIIAEVKRQTNQTVTVTKQTNCYERQRIKRDSFKWYKAMREGEYEYIHKFKERINEILSLQKLHH
jgi:hypothetical protein